MADGHGGDAQTLRDYWAGHGHPGPSGGAERDAIRWGEPGDFDRCVAQVTVHGKMTPEQAKGYCNLRHHDALGYYPATHAHTEGKGYNPSQQRVGSGMQQGGQFTSTGQGTPAQQAAARQAAVFAAANAADAAGDRAQVAAINRRIAGLESTLASLRKQLATISKQKIRRGTGSTVKKPKKVAAAKKTGSAGKKKAGAAGKKTSAASLRSRIASVESQIAQLRQQAAQAAKSVEAAMTKRSEEPTEIVVEGEGDTDHDGDGLFDADGDGDGAVARRVSAKNVRNPRDTPTGRFRTFEGESREAGNAFREGRMHDAVDLLGSASVLATEPGHRTVLDQMQRSLSRVQHVVPQLTKVGPEGYIHGWIKVGLGQGPDWKPVPEHLADKPGRKAAYGDVVTAHHAGGVIVGSHNGAAGRGKKGIARVGVYDPGTKNVTEYEVPRTSLRVATGPETRDAIRRAHPNPGA